MHQTVLLQEAVSALVTNSAGYYVDATFGRGGHSRAILERLGDDGRLLGLDRDSAAAAAGAQLARSDRRFRFEHSAFSRLPEVLEALGVDSVHGVLLDLGVSSPQLDDSSRGFSFLRDGPLDMRMDTAGGITAAEWLARAGEEEIARVLRDFGDERYARRIAAALVTARSNRPIVTTAQLAAVIIEAHPRWERHKHPATRSFQAIRIWINSELEELQALLARVLDLLYVGGRLVVISFHSLEDRLVKRFMRDMARGDDLPPGVPVPDSALNRRLRLLCKGVRPSPEEVAANPRAKPSRPA